MWKTTRLGSKGVILSVLRATLLTTSMLVLPAMNVDAADDTRRLRAAVLQDTPDLSMFNLGTNSTWMTQMLSWALEGFAGAEIDSEPYQRPAQDWRFHEDTLTVEVTLRQGITFRDGVEKTADDVIFAFIALRGDTVYTGRLLQAFDQSSKYYLTMEEMAIAISETDDYNVVMHMAVPYERFFSPYSRCQSCTAYLEGPSDHQWHHRCVWSGTETVTGMPTTNGTY